MTQLDTMNSCETASNVIKEMTIDWDVSCGLIFNNSINFSHLLSNKSEKISQFDIKIKSFFHNGNF